MKRFQIVEKIKTMKEHYSVVKWSRLKKHKEEKEKLPELKKQISILQSKLKEIDYEIDF